MINGDELNIYVASAPNVGEPVLLPRHGGATSGNQAHLSALPPCPRFLANKLYIPCCLSAMPMIF